MSPEVINHRISSNLDGLGTHLIYDKSIQINTLFIRLDISTLMITPNDYVSVISSYSISHGRTGESQKRKMSTGAIGPNTRVVSYVWHFLILALYFISRQQINPKYVIIYSDVYQINGLISTKIGLHMKISPQFFENGLLRIKCVAIISPFNIWSGNKETFIQQQGLQQSDIPLPSIDTREVLFSGEFHKSQVIQIA